jgi:DNA-binding transcriptional ArsR family regulator
MTATSGPTDRRRSQAERALQYVLTEMEGGLNRVRILRTLRERPRNANQVAEALDLDYKTVRHHLNVLREKDLVERGTDGYGAVYLPTDAVRRCWDTVEDIADRLRGA